MEKNREINNFMENFFAEQYAAIVTDLEQNNSRIAIKIDSSETESRETTSEENQTTSNLENSNAIKIESSEPGSKQAMTSEQRIVTDLEQNRRKSEIKTESCENKLREALASNETKKVTTLPTRSEFYPNTAHAQISYLGTMETLSRKIAEITKLRKNEAATIKIEKSEEEYQQRPPAICHVCETGFATAEYLQTHLNYFKTHKYICEVCNLGYAREASLWKHIEKVHHVPTCLMCNGSRANPIRKHKRNKTSYQPYTYKQEFY